MKKRYNEIMDRIEVADEMRERILHNLREADLTKPARKKAVQFSSIFSARQRIAIISEATVMIK